MYIDKLATFSSGQEVTASAASTDHVNQGAEGDAYEGAWIVARVGEAFDALTSLDIQIQTDDASNFSGAETLMEKNVAVADLTANTIVMKMRMPLGAKQYLRGYYEVNGSNATAGTIDLFVVPDVEMG